MFLIELFKKKQFRIRGKKITGLILEEKRLIKVEGKIKFPSKIPPLYVPSVRSFLTVLGLVLISWILSHYLNILLSNIPIINTFLNSRLLSKDSGHYQNLIAIHAGIGAVIFALIIFVAESLRDDKTERARVLLRESFLFPLTVSEILIFFIFAWGQVNIFSIVPVLIVGLFTILSLGRMMKVLLNKKLFAEKRLDMLKERILESIDLVVNERLADHYLLSKHAKEYKLTFYPFSIEEAGFTILTTKKKGIVTDINLSKLSEFSDILDNEARKNNYSYEADEVGSVSKTGSSPIQKTLKAEKIRYTPNSQRYFLKKFHDNVDGSSNIPRSQRHNALMAYDKRLVQDQKVLKRLSDLAEEIFEIKPFKTSETAIREELSGIKDQFISAILNKQLGEIESLMELYRDLAENFIIYLKKYGVNYSGETAQRERGDLFGGWQFIRWLSDDIKDIFAAGLESNDREIARNTSYLPILIAKTAIEYDDHYIFQTFIWYLPSLYHNLSKDQNENFRNFFIDRIGMWGKEICNYNIEPKFKSSKDVASLNLEKDFAYYSLLVFQDLIRKAYDKRDFTSFETFCDLTVKLFKNFEPRYNRDSSSYYDYRLKDPNLSEDEKKDLAEKLEVQKTLEGIGDEIEKRKRQSFFGLSAWVLSDLNPGENNKILLDFYNKLKNLLPSNIKIFTEIFTSVHDFKIIDNWQWNWWDQRPDGEVYQLNSLEKLEKFYGIRTLEILTPKNEGEILAIKLPPSRDLAYLAEGTRDLIKVLDDVQTNPDNWKYVLPAGAGHKVFFFKQILIKAKEEQEQIEEKDIQSRVVSQPKIDEFKKELLETYRQRIIFKSIFSHFNLFVDEKLDEIKPQNWTQKIIFYFKKLIRKNEKGLKLKQYPAGTNRFGINSIVDKAGFIEDWHVHVVQLGSGYGESLAKGEDLQIFDQILKECSSETDIQAAFAKLELGSQPFIVATNSAIYDYISDMNGYSPRWNSGEVLDVNGFVGWLTFKERKIPIFELPELGEQILVLDALHLGKFVQNSPFNKGDNEKMIVDEFYMDIKSFSEDKELLDKFIKEPPDWLKKEGGEDKQIEYLKATVLVHVFERYQFEKDKKFQGFIIKLSKPPAEEILETAAAN
jgi:hypothetical protein